MRERMVPRLLGLGEAFKNFGPPLLVTRRGFGCERAELVLLTEEERMDDRLKARRCDDLHSMQRQREQEWEVGSWICIEDGRMGVSIEIHSSRGSMHLRESSSTYRVSGMS